MLREEFLGEGELRFGLRVMREDDAQESLTLRRALRAGVLAASGGERSSDNGCRMVGDGAACCGRSVDRVDAEVRGVVASGSRGRRRA